jgi:hypothetical protein
VQILTPEDFKPGIPHLPTGSDRQDPGATSTLLLAPAFPLCRGVFALFKHNKLKDTPGGPVIETGRQIHILYLCM